MPKPRTGSVKYSKKRKAWVARLDWADEETGKRMCRKQQVVNKTEGGILVNKWIDDLEKNGAKALEGDRATFKNVAEEYRNAKLVDAVYKNGVKVGGLKSRRTAELHLKALIEYFGHRKIRRITHANLEKFKLQRLSTPTHLGKERALASVNRELALLRTVMSFARREGWITRSPFEQGDSLISLADEVKRDRVLSHDEEKRLLAACDGPRAHLRPLLIAALDTGMRRGELFKLVWADVDLEAGHIRVKAEKAKTQRARLVPVTTRLAGELKVLREKAPPGDGLVFGVTDSVKKSFASVCRAAKISGFRFHDCRHVATTRMIEAGMPALQVMKITGHSQMSTFLRYLNAGEAAAKQAGEALNAYHAKAAAKSEPQSPPV